MKQKLFLILTVLFFIGCENNDNNIQKIELKDGIYQGYFEYKNLKHWSSIYFIDNHFEEYPSGGVMHQKNLFYLNKGTFEIKKNTIQFNAEPNNNIVPDIFPINLDWYLDGEFKLNYLNQDTISFKRGEGDRKILYSLKWIASINE